MSNFILNFNVIFTHMIQIQNAQKHGMKSKFSSYLYLQVPQGNFHIQFCLHALWTPRIAYFTCCSVLRISHWIIYLRDSSTSLYTDLPPSKFYLLKYSMHTQRCIYCKLTADKFSQTEHTWITSSLMKKWNITSSWEPFSDSSPDTPHPLTKGNHSSGFWTD